MTFFRARRAAMACAIVAPLFAASAVYAQDSSATDGPEDPVVAVVNGTEILMSDVQARFEELKATQPQLGAMPMTMVYDYLLDAVIDNALVTIAGRKDGLADDPEVKERMARVQDRIIAGTYMERVISDKVSEEDVTKAYEARKADFTPEQEIHARHILVETEEAAKDALAKLKDGADFAELAKEVSTGPSGSRGGDLGWFTKDRMVPEFAEAAFAMKPGSVSEAPVKTEFGWHVIKVEETRETTFPPLEEMQEELSQELSAAAVQETLAALKDAATIEKFTPDGQPLPEEPEEDATPDEPATPAK